MILSIYGSLTVGPRCVEDRGLTCAFLVSSPFSLVVFSLMFTSGIGLGGWGGMLHSLAFAHNVDATCGTGGGS